MTMRERSHESSARVPVVPVCVNCPQPDDVREMRLQDLAPGVRYRRCDACGFVWATQDGDELRTATS